MNTDLMNRYGFVQRTVAELDGRTSSLGRNFGPPGLRHGHAEHGTRPRHRSRDRVSDVRVQNVRARPAGPEERLDWMQALENFEDRVDSLERHSRLQAQTIAHLNESLEDARRRVFESNTDIEKYKAFIGTVHVTIDNYVNLKVNALQGQIDNVMNVIPSNIDILDYRVKDLEAAMSLLRPNDPATPTGAAVGTNAEHFSMATGQQPQAAPDVTAAPVVPEY